MTGLTLATIGLDEQDSILVRTALELASGIEIVQWRLIDDTELANAILVNVDCSEGRDLVADLDYLSTYWELLNHPVIVRCSRGKPVSQNGDFILSTPLVYATLIELLKKLQSHLAGLQQSDDIPLLSTRLLETDSAPSDDHQASRSADLQFASKLAKAPVAALKSHEQGVTQDTAKLLLNERSDVADASDELPPEAISDLLDRHKTNRNSGNQAVEAGSGEMEEPESKLETNNLPVGAELRSVDGRVLANHKPMRVSVAPSEESFRARTRPARQFHTNMRFLGLLADVISKGRSVVITHAVFPPVRILPLQASFQSAPDTASNADLFRVPAAEFKVVPWSRAPGKQALRKQMKLPLWVLLYSAALYGSEGRLRQGVNPYSEMRLREAPDFRMLPHAKDHMKIVGFMLENIADLERIASETEVSIETVIEFTNACDELLLIDRYFNDLAAEDKYRLGRKNKYWKRLYTAMSGKSNAVRHSFFGHVIPRWISGHR